MQVVEQRELTKNGSSEGSGISFIVGGRSMSTTVVFVDFHFFLAVQFGVLFNNPKLDLTLWSDSLSSVPAY